MKKYLLALACVSAAVVYNPIEAKKSDVSEIKEMTSWFRSLRAPTMADLKVVWNFLNHSEYKRCLWDRKNCSKAKFAALTILDTVVSAALLYFGQDVFKRLMPRKQKKQTVTFKSEKKKEQEKKLDMIIKSDWLDFAKKHKIPLLNVENPTERFKTYQQNITKAYPFPNYGKFIWGGALPGKAVYDILKEGTSSEEENEFAYRPGLINKAEGEEVEIDGITSALITDKLSDQEKINLISDLLKKNLGELHAFNKELIGLLAAAEMKEQKRVQEIRMKFMLMQQEGEYLPLPIQKEIFEMSKEH